MSRYFCRFQTKGATSPLSREEKLERYKRSQASKKRLEQVVRTIGSLKSKGEDDLDSFLREQLLLDIDCAIKDSLEEIDTVIKEDEILKHMLSRNLHFSTSKESTSHPNPPSKGITLTHIGKDLNVTRETLKDGVFGMSWAQPTMTLDDVVDIEMRLAAEKALREERYRAENPEVLSAKQMLDEGLEDDKDIADSAAKKDRDWDDWKDDNPKGSGVTKRF